MSGKDRRPVAFQGARGAFSEEAARKLLGEEVEVLPCERFEDLFRSLKEGRTEGAVVPIENTLAGSVHENYDHLQNFELPIVAETSVRIVHNLIARKNVPFAKIKRVYSHPVALNQCLDFFAQNPQIEKNSVLRHGRQRQDDHRRRVDRRGRYRLYRRRRDLRRDGFCASRSKAIARISPASSCCAARSMRAVTPSTPMLMGPGRHRWYSARVIFLERCFAL